MDDTVTFAAELPAWCGADGMPLSWQHFRYGMEVLARKRARDMLRQMHAVRIAQTGNEKLYTDEHAKLRTEAGYR